MDTDDFADEISKYMKIFDENIDILCDVDAELDDQNEDELLPDMQLHQLLDMTDDVAESFKLKKAESNFMRRQAENL